LPPANISALNCNAASTSGTLEFASAANGVQFSIPYSGGNGGYLNAQAIQATGINGLSATPTNSEIQSGNGILNYVVSGTPTSSGTATFNIYIGTLSCQIDFEVASLIPASCGAPNVHNPSLTYGSMTDQQGNVYKTIVIGTQEWMAENLKTSIYRNGEAIANVTDNNQWANLITGAWSHTNNDSQFDCPYGKLYNWYAVADQRNVCPTGWHVPTDAEWSVLINYLDPNADGGYSYPNLAGGKLKSSNLQYWCSSNQDATNESGFSGISIGGRGFGGGFSTLGFQGLWYSSTLYDQNNVLMMNMDCNTGNAGLGTGAKLYGISVRCLRD
jgi:uncharacterized protein (TIGR02145 family)